MLYLFISVVYLIQSYMEITSFMNASLSYQFYYALDTGGMRNMVPFIIWLFPTILILLYCIKKYYGFFEKTFPYFAVRDFNKLVWLKKIIIDFHKICLGMIILKLLIKFLLSLILTNQPLIIDIVTIVLYLQVLIVLSLFILITYILYKKDELFLIAFIFFVIIYFSALNFNDLYISQCLLFSGVGWKHVVLLFIVEVLLVKLLFSKIMKNYLRKWVE